MKRWGVPEDVAPLYLFLLALFPGTLGHVLMNWAHAHVTAFSISMILLAAPVVSSAAAWSMLRYMLPKPVPPRLKRVTVTP